MTYTGSKPINIILHIQINKPPPYTITKNNINFKNILIKHINNNQYLQPITYKLNYKQQLTNTNNLHIQLQNPTNIINNKTILNTNINKFNIHIQNTTNNSLITIKNNT